MVLYARSDVMSIAIPATSGGCGNSHSRPVRSGNPVKVWGLECVPCESYLRGDRKPKIIHTTAGDKDKGVAPRLTHVADSDPHWSTTPEGIPLTPDEQHVHKLRAEQGKQQLDMLTAYAALRQGNIEIPEQAQWLINRTLEDLARPIVKGSVVCVNGHDNPSGIKFCGECGANMENRAAIESPEEDVYKSEIPLESLHVSTLKKLARQKGLPDRGKKADLITSLREAA